jgi:hypothetical protein
MRRGDRSVDSRYRLWPNAPEFRTSDQDSAEHRNGLVKNLSCEGLLFTTDEFLPRDSLVKLEVRLPSSPRPVPIVSKVSRLGASQGEDSYTFGVEFSNPSPSTHYDITLSHSFIASVDQPYRCRSLSSRSGTS